MQKMIDDGGPAFPRSGHYPDMRSMAIDDLREARDYIATPQEGMTLRDYFAVHAPTMGDWGEAMQRAESPHGECDAVAILARWRYAYADAMLRARTGGAA